MAGRPTDRPPYAQHRATHTYYSPTSQLNRASGFSHCCIQGRLRGIDGLLELWVVNGNTLEMASDTTRLKPQLLYLFQQEPRKGFFEVGRQASPTLKQHFVGCGGAHAD